MTARNPGVTRLPSGRWRWRIMIDGRQHTGTEPTAALAALARAECHIDHGGNPDHNPTVRDILEAHQAHARRADTTLANWRWAMAALPDAFLERKAVDITPRLAAHLWRQLDGLPPHQLVKASNLMAGAWKAAYLPNVWRDAPPPQPPPTARISPPSEDEVRALIAAATAIEPWFGAWCTVAAFTGARAGEVCGIQWDDVDTDGGTIAILRNVTRTGRINPTKTGVRGQRRVPVDTDTLEAIENLRRNQCPDASTAPTPSDADTAGSSASPSAPSATISPRGRTSGVDARRSEAARSADAPSSPWLFPRGDGEPVRPDGAAKRLNRACELVGMQASPHQLRHFFVTMMLADGCPVVDVAGFIGDTPKTVMQVYAHWIPSRSRQYVERLGERVRGSARSA